MKLGYTCILNDKESLDDHINTLKQYGCEKLFSDTQIDKKAGRNGRNAMFEYAREDDIIVVQKLKYLTRSMQELENIVQEMRNRGIQFVSIKDRIDTTNENGEVYFHMIKVIAEFEKEQVTERIKIGIRNAREKGVKLGRKSANQKQKEKAYEMYVQGTYTMKEITEETGISRATIYRYIDQMKG